MFTRSLPTHRTDWTHVASLGVRLHTRVWGASHARGVTPIVLVSGLGVSSRYWIPLGRRLGDRFHVLAPDLPGFGRSPPSPGTAWPAGPAPRQQAEHLRAWMDARGIRRAILIGHSTGTQTVADFAARHPERVKRVVLAAPTYAAGYRSFAQQIPRLLLAAFFERLSLVPKLIYDYLSIGVLRVIQQASRTMRSPIENSLPRIAAPCLIVCGEFDPIVPLRWAESLAALLPRGAMIVIGRVGHAFQYASPDITARLIGDFVAGRLDAAHGVHDGSVVVPLDAARSAGSFISPTAHGVLDYLASLLVMIASRRFARKPRRLLAAASIVGAASNAVSEHRVALVRALPMLPHVSVDGLLGVGLLIASATYLRGESRAARLATAGLGLYHLAAGALTVKPTGPATYHRPRTIASTGVGGSNIRSTA